VTSARAFSLRVIVGVCNAHDRAAILAAGLVPPGDVWLMDSVPSMLPLNLCRALQAMSCDTLTDGAVVCFTEADQQLNVCRAHTRFLLSRPASERAHLSGHRAEEDIEGHRAEPGYAVVPLGRDGRRFALANEPLGPALASDVEGWYRPADFLMAYSASFLCTARTLRSVDFRVVPWSETLPRLHGNPELVIEAPAISMFFGGTCYKTRAFGTGEYSLVTVHLSRSGAPRSPPV
jgi:hypothetical protein